MSQTNSPLPREVADAYVDDFIALDPVTGTYLGVQESSSRLPDYSPAGQDGARAARAGHPGRAGRGGTQARRGK